MSTTSTSFLKKLLVCYKLSFLRSVSNCPLLVCVSIYIYIFIYIYPSALLYTNFLSELVSDNLYQQTAYTDFPSNNLSICSPKEKEKRKCQTNFHIQPYWLFFFFLRQMKISKKKKIKKKKRNRRIFIF